MGLFSRLKDLFKAKIPQEDYPVRVLSDFIEFYSEKLRELSVSVNRSESEWLLLKGKMNLHIVNSAMYRDKADQEARLGNADMAKYWLVQALSQETYSENLKSEVERLQRTTKQSKDTLTQLENKLLTAKEMRKKFMLRQEAAKSTMQMNAVLKESFSSSALERMEEETFLAEAKAELMQSRPK